MAHYGRTSKKRLVGVHPVLEDFAYRVVKIMDCTVICGLRTIEKQKWYVGQGLSRTMKSKHLKQLDGFAHAIDLGPYIAGGIPWDNEKYFYKLIGVQQAVAHEMDITIRNGSDWDRDGDMDDQKFMDLVHTELVLH